MISFGNGTHSSSPFDDSEEPPEGLKNLIKAIFGKPFPEGTSLNSLNSFQVLQVIEEVMYKQDCSKFNLTIKKEPTDDTLSLHINLKA